MLNQFNNYEQIWQKQQTKRPGSVIGNSNNFRKKQELAETIEDQFG